MTRDPRLPTGFGPDLARDDQAALAAIRSAPHFAVTVALLRAQHARNRQRDAVPRKDVLDWLELRSQQMHRFAEVLREVASLPAFAPPRVRAWLSQAATARGWEGHYRAMDRDAREVAETVDRWNALFADALRLAKAERAGRGRPRTATAREEIAQAIDELGRQYRLDAGELDTLRRIVFFNLAPATVTPPQRFAKLKRPTSKMPRAD